MWSLLFLFDRHETYEEDNFALEYTGRIEFVIF